MLIKVQLFRSLNILLVLLLLSNAHAAEQEPSVTPYRPTLSNPAALSAPGWLELEMGWQHVEGGGDKGRDSVPLLAKLAFSENWGLLLGGEAAIRRVDSNDQLFTGNGDTVLMLKHRIPAAGADTAWGIEAGYKSPTAPDTIGSGKTDYIVNGIFSTSIADNPLDVNLGATRLGSAGDGESDMQYAWAAALAHDVSDAWGLFGELSGSARSGTAAQAQLMAGATFNWSRRVVLDAGMSRGLTTGSADWTAFAGMSVLLGRLW